MGSETEIQIPTIDLSKKSVEEMERGSKEWDAVSKMVKEACEDYGCFEVVYDPISTLLKDDVFSIIRHLFELPLETKIKNNNPKPYHSYAGLNLTPPPRLYEGFGIPDASNYESLKHFAQLLISDPLSQLHFSQSFSRMMKPVDELHDTIKKLIMDGYDIDETDSSISCDSLVRVMKYKRPPPEEAEDDNIGLYAHTDKPFCTLICEDQCSGLELQAKDDDALWIPWIPSPHSFIFIVGDPLMAWSNGRFHAVKHRVVMKKGSEKDRYSFAAFLIPKEGTIIKPPKQLIDQHHPRTLKDFDYFDFLNFSFTTEAIAMDSAKQLSAFAAL
ncbi:1-aminocyclopropane-1-carboxylate oxidase [Euphorbia peplus]|nr:1-aminocyclopropane-1-carboxylate oxidase [Euphorbia peplus]